MCIHLVPEVPLFLPSASSLRVARCGSQSVSQNPRMAAKRNQQDSLTRQYAGAQNLPHLTISSDRDHQADVIRENRDSRDNSPCTTQNHTPIVQGGR